MKKYFTLVFALFLPIFMMAQTNDYTKYVNPY